ncbi:hypothetical protein Ga0609869_002731 [Rhodovulum iodosum]|uniref:Hedgehog/Intein (Hint) domain-containing protein n=1 Tax=Rhodovulum iodosum TaxID=68291 RepID=A0ABV3XVJ9_9RHOB|nr:Hint domain-containing protein [Rhodovulum robiginosum]
MLTQLTQALGGEKRNNPGQGAGASGTAVVGKAAGLPVGTLLACDGTWRRVDSLEPGDRVLTFDHGPQPIVEIDEEVTWCEGADGAGEDWPFLVPAGALGNVEPMELMPDQSVLIESDLAEILYGDPFALLPVALLEGVNGIRRRGPTRDGVDLSRLIFERDEVVFANGSALLYCPCLRKGAGSAHATGYPMPSREEAKGLARTYASAAAGPAGAATEPDLDPYAAAAGAKRS